MKKIKTTIIVAFATLLNISTLSFGMEEEKEVPNNFQSNFVNFFSDVKKYSPCLGCNHNLIEIEYEDGSFQLYNTKIEKLVFKKEPLQDVVSCGLVPNSTFVEICFAGNLFQLYNIETGKPVFKKHLKNVFSYRFVDNANIEDKKDSVQSHRKWVAVTFRDKNTKYYNIEKDCCCLERNQNFMIIKLKNGKYQPAPKPLKNEKLKLKIQTKNLKNKIKIWPV